MTRRASTTTLPVPTLRPVSWQLHLLDGFELLDETGRVVEAPATTQRLLAFLALRDRPVQRLHVAGSLWPDSTDLRAAACLRSALWRVGTICGDAVEVSPGSIQLGGGVSVDVRELVSIVDHARTGHPPNDAAALLHDLELELLPDWYDEWVTLWQERWRQVRLHGLELVAGVLARSGSFGLAVDAGLAAVHADPLRESAHRVLIEIHALEGNRSEALRQFRSYEAVMREQLDLAPAPSMLALIDRVTGAPPPDPALPSSDDQGH